MAASSEKDATQGHDDIEEDGVFMWSRGQILSDEAFAKHLQERQDRDDEADRQAEESRLTKEADPWTVVRRNKRSKAAKKFSDSGVDIEREQKHQSEVGEAGERQS